jgi:outer membrane protein TolC
MTDSIFRAALSFLVVAAISPALAGAEQITLSEALERARGNAPEIAAARARQEASELRLDQARGHRLPSIRLQEIWMRTDSPAEAFALQLNQKRFSFPEFAASDPNNPDPIESATTRLEVELPLYTGGEIGSRVEQATLAAQAASATAEWTADNAALAAAEAYIHLAQAREHVVLLERSLGTVEAHVELARAYSRQGMLVRSELLRAEVEQARIEDMLTRARGMAEVAAANLSFRLSALAGTEWGLEPLPMPESLDRDVAEWIDFSRDRADLRAARHMLEAGRLESKAVRSRLMPKLGILARHDLVDDTPFGTNADATSIMAFGSIELWRGGTHRSEAQAAEAEVAAGEQEVAQYVDAIALQVRNAFVQATSALDRHTTAVEAREAAVETERITEERFAQGVVKTIDVLDASTALREAEMRELVARADAHLARFRLAVASGRRPEDALTSPSPTDRDPSEASNPSNAPVDQETPR